MLLCLSNQGEQTDYPKKKKKFRGNKLKGGGGGETEKNKLKKIMGSIPSSHRNC